MSIEFDIDRIGGLRAMRALEELVVRTGDAAMQHFLKGVIPEKKPDRSPVTAADREAEQAIRGGVLRRGNRPAR
jgi:3'-phosphoadenosine 5'-phosphosulfate (PAPS) 3'-phosphatase